MIEYLLYLFLPVILVWVWVRVSLPSQYGLSGRRPLPPGPAPWPVVGNLFCLSPKPHKSLAALAATHGPLLGLRFGFRTTVVISSPSIAREVMLRHDAAFSGRSIQETVTVLGHYQASVVFLWPCPRWRFLRKICSSHVFANSRTYLQQGQIQLQAQSSGQWQNSSEIPISSGELEQSSKTVGKGNPFVEAHSAQLPFLQAVVKETLRMHPPVPFLVPRNVETDVELCGYSIPKNSLVLVNVWAMGRDSNTWKNPDSYEPERFLGSTLDYKGHDSELLPFGFGRRICPGIPLARKVLLLVLGSMLHSFNWRLPDGMSSTEIDVDDKFGFTLHKAHPLFVVPVTPK